MGDALEEIKTIRKELKKLCPTLSVRNGKGTAWGWVEISGSLEYGNFTEAESSALRSVGLTPGGNFAVISPDERRRWATKGDVNIPKNIPEGGNMSKVYTTLATFPSSSDLNKVYAVKKDEFGELSCNCRGWTTKKPGQERTCKHTRRVEAQIASGQLVATQPMQTPRPEPVAVTAKKTTQGGSLEDLFQMLDKKGL